MKVLGFITEYNPFHNGHKYHLAASKDAVGATHTVAIMSGNFLQRGEPALTHKWIRAKMAVREGIDLVIELPVAYACSSAEYFAFGAISLLHKLGIIDSVCFGSEAGELKPLLKIAKTLYEEPLEYKNSLQDYIKKGLPYPKARSLALECFLNQKNLAPTISSPNNILGIEYLKALYRLNSSIKPYTIKRVQADYHSHQLEGTICSATAIRKHLAETNKESSLLFSFMPKESYALLMDSIKNHLAPVTQSSFDQTILYHLRYLQKSRLMELSDVSEGLENRIKEAAYSAKSYAELLDLIKTKRYTLTRIQRILIHSLLGLSRQELLSMAHEKGPSYARILAFTQKGAELIRLMKSTSSIPIISNINKSALSDTAAQKMLFFDLLATDIYSLGYPAMEHRYGGWDHYMQPYFHR
ncbi:nucleotidyltransferase [Geosporobacter ferrireducens]|uniref:tRNA(Met) cytidine acetate ligase n=1 Tax=Geosporobacter ferrireducens TaxID=1424294 RepID=A0A1D8GBW1_9FIRM|nr:nucleotidyltransferase [Geosporobacter ferrireducens]AOT68401.1 hypothetical protein Gferi_01610 [Geosporobacter ferrireducens]MTI53852.1 nucleotidyltransferase [Geosporobacter ferrireducens]